jgi:hypothetical protein
LPWTKFFWAKRPVMLTPPRKLAEITLPAPGAAPPTRLPVTPANELPSMSTPRVLPIEIAPETSVPMKLPSTRLSAAEMATPVPLAEMRLRVPTAVPPTTVPLAWRVRTPTRFPSGLVPKTLVPM